MIWWPNFLTSGISFCVPRNRIVNVNYRIQYGICLIFTFLIFLSGSVFAQNENKWLFKKKRKKVEVSNIEIRLRLTDYGGGYTEYIERAADKIYFQAEEHEMKKAAVMWKIYGISAMNKAINMPDPIASFYNAWPLAKQTVIFFDTGPGAETFGEYAGLALEVSQQLERNLDSIIIDIAGRESFVEAEPVIDEWAREHPIEDFYFSRESTLKFFAKWLGDTNFGIGRSVSTLTEQVLELSNRINLYTDLLPRQARWQADLALIDYLEDTAFILGRLDQLILSLERVSKTVELAPELIEYNRDIVLEDIDGQRRESLDLLVKERKAVIEQLIEERIAVVNVIAKERLNVLEQLKSEREIVMEELAVISTNTVLKSGEEIERIVDKVFWRTIILLAVIGIFIIIAIIVYKRV
jgi:hypothetical protein